MLDRILFYPLDKPRPVLLVAATVFAVSLVAAAICAPVFAIIPLLNFNRNQPELAPLAF
jgi:hypothetical protein